MEENNSSYSRNSQSSSISVRSNTQNNRNSRQGNKSGHLGENSGRYSKVRNSSLDAKIINRELEIMKLKEIDPYQWKNIPIVLKDCLFAILDNLVRYNKN